MTTKTVSSPGSDHQRIRILLEDALVAEGRYKRDPSPGHFAEATACLERLNEAVGAEDLDERWQKFARGIADDRLADDGHYGRCMCWRCKTTSDSTARVPADHGREPPRAAAG